MCRNYFFVSALDTFASVVFSLRNTRVVPRAAASLRLSSSHRRVTLREGRLKLAQTSCGGVHSQAFLEAHVLRVDAHRGQLVDKRQQAWLLAAKHVFLMRDACRL